MKIDKKNFYHWITLLKMLIIVLISAFLCFFIKKRKSVLFYGHKLNGNLLPIYEYYKSHNGLCYFGSIDRKYIKSIEKKIDVIDLGSFQSAFLLARAKVIITSHGLHSLILFKYLTKTKFVDVWHGIPFKGFDEKDFSLQLTYDEIWVASEFHKELYIEKFGFQKDRVHVTGYARTDILINGNSQASILLHQYGVNSQSKKIITFCPTWKQDDNNRNLLPFDIDHNVFFEQLNNFSTINNVIFIIRTHLNSHTDFSKHKIPNIYFLNADDYPITEEILLISDMLICDWSSICFDFLLLKRPTIFLDVSIPFKKGLSISASYRYGDIASSMDDVFYLIFNYLKNENIYFLRNEKKINASIEKIYGKYIDGKSTSRCYKRLVNLIEN